MGVGVRCCFYVKKLQVLCLPLPIFLLKDPSDDKNNQRLRTVEPGDFPGRLAGGEFAEMMNQHHSTSTSDPLTNISFPKERINPFKSAIESSKVLFARVIKNNGKYFAATAVLGLGSIGAASASLLKNPSQDTGFDGSKISQGVEQGTKKTTKVKTPIPTVEERLKEFASLKGKIPDADLKETAKLLVQVDTIRAKWGLEPVNAPPEIVELAWKRAKYVNWSKMSEWNHKEENPQNPYYTARLLWQRLEKSGLLEREDHKGYYYAPSEGLGFTIQGLLELAGHKRIFAIPGRPDFGIANAGSYLAVVSAHCSEKYLKTLTPELESRYILTLGDGETDVPCTGSFSEGNGYPELGLMPEWQRGRGDCGFPFSFSFIHPAGTKLNASTRIRNIKAKLFEIGPDGQEKLVDCYFLTGENRDERAGLDNCVLIASKDPMKPATKYRLLIVFDDPVTYGPGVMITRKFRTAETSSATPPPPGSRLARQIEEDKAKAKAEEEKKKKG